MAAVLGKLSNQGAEYWIVPIDDVELDLLRKKSVYGLGKHSPGRKGIKAGDWICFYQSGRGIVGHARALSAPEFRPELTSIFYPLAVALESVSVHPDSPVRVDRSSMAKLDGAKKYGSAFWGPFVATAHRISRNDFEVLVSNES